MKVETQGRAAPPVELHPGLLEAVERLRADVAGLGLPLDLPSAAQARVERDALLAQLDDHLMPRLRRRDAPLLAVIGGSTGAGKSTLLNSLVRREVTRAGVLRPTTRSPVLVHNPHDSGSFLSRRILPGLTRVTSEAPEPAQPVDPNATRATGLRLVPYDGVPRGLALLDAPDIDSLVETNRELAMQLLSAADLWLFVTTAARYADAAPWQMLNQAAERGAAVAVILDRVPLEVLPVVRLHLAGLLRDRGLATVPMFTIPESELEAGYLPAEVVKPLSGWLERLSRDPRSRELIARRTLVGALDSLSARVETIAAAADDQSAAASAMRADARKAFVKARRAVGSRLADRTILRGEVLGRWQEYVVAGDLVRLLGAKPGRRRGKPAARGERTRAAPFEPMGVALRKSLVATLRMSLQDAVEQVDAEWREHTGGSVGDPDAAGTGPISMISEVDVRIERAVQEWHDDITELVRSSGPNRRTTAHGFSLGVEGAAVILSFVTFSYTDGPAVAKAAGGADPADAAVLAQRLLETVFGDHLVRTMVATSRANLQNRVETLVQGEGARCEALIDEARINPAKGAALRGHLAVVEAER